MKRNILVIDDDSTISTLVQCALQDFNIVSAATLAEAEIKMTKFEYVAILIDVQLPDGDGLRFLQKISNLEKISKIPKMILSQSRSIADKVMAFTYGADDFFEKPFDPIELHARVTAKIRRFEKEQLQKHLRQVKDICLDFDRQKALLKKDGVEIDLDLTGVELKILSYLTNRMENVYSREQILNAVWGDTFISDRTVDSHVAHLRRKIEPSQLQIETVKNCGYRAVFQK